LWHVFFNFKLHTVNTVHCVLLELFLNTTDEMKRVAAGVHYRI